SAMAMPLKTALSRTCDRPMKASGPQKSRPRVKPGSTVSASYFPVAAQAGPRQAGSFLLVVAGITPPGTLPGGTVRSLAQPRAGGKILTITAEAGVDHGKPSWCASTFAP